VAPRPAGDAEEARWRLLEGVTSFLQHVAGGQPLVLVLEDLHWADRGTLDLLTHLARNLGASRLLVVGAYRDVEVDRAHPLAATLAELRRVAPFERVLLRGLDREGVRKMVAAITQFPPTEALVQAVHRQTEGNPLFVQEVVRYLAEEGLVAPDRAGGEFDRQTPLVMHIPEGLREVIGKRLSRLSPQANQVLAVAAVIGRDFDLATLLAVADLPEGVVLSACAGSAVCGAAGRTRRRACRALRPIC
jgi:predicted ATPase